MSKRHRNRLRESSEELFFRHIELRAEDADASGLVRVIASTDAAVEMGGFREVLEHKIGCVDFTSCRSSLLNHDRNQIVGGVKNIAVAGGKATAEIMVSPDARTQTGVKVLDLIRSGALAGVSIGYRYSDKDATYDDESRTITVRKWSMREISFTPTQADLDAQTVRSLPEHFTKQRSANAPQKDAFMTLEQLIAMFGEKNRSLLSKLLGENKSPAEIAGAVRAADLAAEAKEKADKERAEKERQSSEGDEKARASELQKLRLHSQLVSVAESHGLRGSDYFDEANMESALKRMMKDKADAESKRTIPVIGGVANGDQADKARDAFAGAMAFNAGIRNGDLGELQKNNPLVGRGIKHAVRKYARLMGIDTEDWSDKDVAYFAVGKPEMMDQRYARSANITSSTFPNFVFLNALTKIVARGYEQGSAVARYKSVVSTQTVPDFKQFSVGALASANFAQTAEDTAFPELSKAEGVYNSTVKMWGGTLSLTVQAIVGDDTAQFDRLMGQAGSIADKTIDRRVFQKLLMGTSAVEATSTWTSNTSSGGSLVYTTADLAAAARGKLSIVRAALMNKVGLDGNPLGTIPRFLICGPTRETEARGITGSSGPLLTAGVAQTPVSLEVIATPWLEASALTGNSTTSYYLLADPNDVTGLLLTKIRGYESVQVQPYDAGAVAAMNFKLWLPFEADLHFVTVGASTKTIAAAQQGTT